MHTFDHILNQPLLCMPSLQLGLPEMVMGVNEARGNDLALAVDDFDLLARRHRKFWPNFGDDIVVDEYICVNERNNVVTFIMTENCSPTK